MILSSPSQPRASVGPLSCYMLASLGLAGLYWGFIRFLDSLPCGEMLCNLDWMLAFFIPVVIVAILTPLINYALLRWGHGMMSPMGAMVRLAFGAIGTGFSILVVAAFADSLAGSGLASIDLSPQGLIAALLFGGLTWLNLHCVRTILQRACPID
ncbi:hypothetical protein LMIY3S_00562 [Labrys miyagiensis]